MKGNKLFYNKKYMDNITKAKQLIGELSDLLKKEYNLSAIEYIDSYGICGEMGGIDNLEHDWLDKDTSDETLNKIIK